jgi:hypothetical protein
MVVCAVLEGAKEQTIGDKDIAGGLRNKVATNCFQGALGRHLVAKFGLERAPFPGQAELNTWLEAPLWVGNMTIASISSSAFAERLKSYFILAGVNIDKVLHAARVWAARHMDEGGLGTEAILRHGRWSKVVAVLHYLTNLQPGALMSMGGWPDAHKGDFDCFWHERFCVVVPIEMEVRQ